MAKSKKEVKEEVVEAVEPKVKDLGSDKARLLELHKVLTDLRVTRIGDLEGLIARCKE